MFMKKKFINGLLLVAMIVGTTSSLVSCKDYDDEKNIDLQEQMFDMFKEQNAELMRVIEALGLRLDNRIDSLRNAFDLCKGECKKTKDRLDSLIRVYNYFTGTTYQNFYTDVTNNYAKRTWVEGLLLNYYTKPEVDDLLKGKVDTATFSAYKTFMANEIIRVEAMFANYYTITQVDSLLRDTLDKYYTKKQVDSLLKLIKPVVYGDTTIINNIYGDTTIVYGDTIINYGDTTIVNNYYTTGIDSAKCAEICHEIIRELEGKVQNLENWQAVIDPLVKRDSVRIDSLVGACNVFNTKIGNLEKHADSVDVVLLRDSIRLDALEAGYKELKDTLKKYATIEYVDTQDGILNDRIDSIVTVAIPDLKNQIKDAKERIEDVKDSLANVITEAVKTVNNRIDSLAKADKDSVKNLRDDLQTLRNEYKEFEKNTKERINGISDSLATLDETVKKIETKVEQLSDSVAKIVNSMAKFISGITINGTENPVFGEINTPIGVRSYILATYHGKTSDAGLQFPAYEEQYYASTADFKRVMNDGAVLKNVKNPVSKKGDLISQDGAVGNAGTVYVTVNPTNRDFSGTQFTLINSKNEESPIVLSDLRKSDHLLQFGWNRARQTGDQSANGFYEAYATISEDMITNGRLRLNVDLEGIKNVLADVKNWQDGISATNIATTIYENLHQVLEASALKASWTDDVSGEEMSVVSQYDIAAATVHPLGFAFMKDVKYNNELLKVEDFLDDFTLALDNTLGAYADKLKIRYDELAQYILGLQYKGYDVATNTLTIVAVVPAGTFAEDEKIVYNSDHTKQETVWSKNADGTYDINIRFSALSEIMATLIRIYGSPEEVEKNIDNVKDKIDALVNEVSDFLGGLQKDVNSMSTTFGLDKLYSYIDMLNGHFKRWLVPNKYVQPLMLIHNDNGYKRLSRYQKRPTKLSSTDFRIIPTTYNVEVLAPAYKKVVLATKVWDASGAEATGVRDEFNAQQDINTVMDGLWTGIDVTIKEGYVYELLLMEVDYCGEIATRKYYVTKK